MKNYRKQAIHNMAIGLWTEKEAKDYIHTQATLETTRTMFEWLGKQEVKDVNGESLIGESDRVDFEQGMYD